MRSMNTTSLADVLVRPSTMADLPAITAIYADALLQGTGTFETEAPDLAQMSLRRDDVLARGLPWLVAETAAVAQAGCCWPS